MTKNNSTFHDTAKAIIYFIYALAFVLSAVWLASKINPRVQDNVVPTPSPIMIPYKGVVCPKEFGAFNQDQMQVTYLIDKPKTMFASNGKFVNSQVVITKNETKESEVACGYLAVKAHTSDGPLKSWENLYINPNGFGGHIDKSTQFGLGDSNTGSEYVFSLSDIQYWKTKVRRNLLTADWTALFNVSDTVTFDINFNTQDRSGIIDSMSIVYKCWNPATGQENKDCKLKVDKSVDTESSSLR